MSMQDILHHVTEKKATQKLFAKGLIEAGVRAGVTGGGVYGVMKLRGETTTPRKRRKTRGYAVGAAGLAAGAPPLQSALSRGLQKAVKLGDSEKEAFYPRIARRQGLFGRFTRKPTVVYSGVTDRGGLLNRIQVATNRMDRDKKFLREVKSMVDGALSGLNKKSGAPRLFKPLGGSGSGFLRNPNASPISRTMKSSGQTAGELSGGKRHAVTTSFKGAGAPTKAVKDVVNVPKFRDQLKSSQVKPVKPITQSLQKVPGIQNIKV